jgi:hypothetical protein
VPRGVDLLQAGEELLEFVLGLQPPCREVRYGHEAQFPYRFGRGNPHFQVLIAQEGDVDSRAQGNERSRLDERRDVFAGHLKRKILHELKGCCAVDRVRNFSHDPHPFGGTLRCAHPKFYLC